MFRMFPATVTFPLTGLRKKDITSLTVLRREYLMDTARLELNVAYDDLNKYVFAGSPLRIRWGPSTRYDEFFGYVHSFQPMTDGVTKSTTIVAISAAYPMYNESGQTYTEVGIHNVAQEIGDNYRFQVETDPHPYVHNQILQKGDSDWLLLSRLAQQWGYVLQMDGVTLIFRSLSELLEENYRNSSTARTSAEGFLVDPRSNLLSFEESYSATSAAPLTTTGFYGVNPVDVDVVAQEEADAQSIFQEIDVSRSITSDLEGELKTESVRAQSQFPYDATAVIRAPYRKKPFDCYRVYNDGTWKTWVIRSIKHTITGDDYTAEVILGSDGVDHSLTSTANARLDLSVMIKRNQRTRRPIPVIVNSRPYLVGAGASAVVPDQRWKALVMTVPLNDLEEGT